MTGVQTCALPIFSVVAKIERPEALKNFKAILHVTDAIMIARGDLGVEVPLNEVPQIQKRLISECNDVGVPVITATQMLESMIDAPTPTRAEVSDVATAVYDGADAVMLSGETAMGKYPVETAAMMNRIIERVERAPNYRKMLEAEELEPEATAADAISAAARQVARTLSAAAIVTFTTSGSTTLRAARERPDVPIICLTPVIETARRLAVAAAAAAVDDPVVGPQPSVVPPRHGHPGRARATTPTTQRQPSAASASIARWMRGPASGWRRAYSPARTPITEMPLIKARFTARVGIRPEAKPITRKRPPQASARTAWSKTSPPTGS